jgi:hypothetical protein
MKRCEHLLAVREEKCIANVKEHELDIVHSVQKVKPGVRARSALVTYHLTGVHRLHHPGQPELEIDHIARCVSRKKCNMLILSGAGRAFARLCLG